jgi:hypothetical protein
MLSARRSPHNMTFRFGHINVKPAYYVYEMDAADASSRATLLARSEFRKGDLLVNMYKEPVGRYDIQRSDWLCLRSTPNGYYYVVCNAVMFSCLPELHFPDKSESPLPIKSFVEVSNLYVGIDPEDMIAQNNSKSYRVREAIHIGSPLQWLGLGRAERAFAR